MGGEEIHGLSVNTSGQWSCETLAIIDINLSIFKTTHLREDRSKDLNILTLHRNPMHPIHAHTRLPNHPNQIRLRICLAQTIMRACSKDQPILTLTFRISRHPPLWVKRIRLRISFRVVERGPAGGDNHAAFGTGIGICDWEGLFDDIGDEDDGRPVAQDFFYDGVGVGQVFKEVHAEADILVAVTCSKIFGAHAIEDLRSVGHELKQPGAGAAGSVLRGEEECEDCLGDFEVGKIADYGRGFLGGVDGEAFGDFGVVGGAVKHGFHPGVHDAGYVAANSHAGFALCGTFGEFGEDHVGGFFAVPGLGEGQDDGEVHEFKGGCYHPVVVCDFLDGGVGHVVAYECSAGYGAHEFSKDWHEWRSLLGVGLF